MIYDNIKSHQKPGFHPFARRYILGKTTGEGQIDPSLPPPHLPFKGGVEGGMMVQHCICLNSSVSCQCGPSSHTPAKILLSSV